jgi:hypothetical protein
MVALLGYVHAHWKTRNRVRRPGNQYAAQLHKFREQRPYQGGEQVVQDLTQIIDFREPCSPAKQAGFFVFRYSPLFNPRPVAAQTKATTLIEHHI